MSTPTDTCCSLVNAGAAASSVAQAVTWLHDDKDSLAYAAHAVVYLTRPVHGNVVSPPVWQTYTTLRTQLDETNVALQITALARVQQPKPQQEDNLHHSTRLLPTALVTGFSDGSLTVWIQQQSNETNQWKEQVLIDIVSGNPSKNGTEAPRSLTALAASWMCAPQQQQQQYRLAIVTGSSSGANYYEYRYEEYSDDQRNIIQKPVLHAQSLSHTAIMSVSMANSNLIFLGTAAPRHNRILVYHRDTAYNNNDSTLPLLHLAGGLTGHLDWIGGMAWNDQAQLLASASQDARIRLWKFTTTATTTTTTTMEQLSPETVKYIPVGDNDNDNSDTDDDSWEEQAAEEEEEAGEARLEFSAKPNQTTRVTLEALLLGHEEMVTSVAWYPQQKRTSSLSSSASLMLLSSSMDRSILLWTPSAEDGIWTPLTRVGSAGGILGGSVGSSLLGYLNVSVNATGQILIGHAHGGSLHTWRLEEQPSPQQPLNEEKEIVFEDNSTTTMSWRAQPGVTGHFRGVVDLSWETNRGDYLLSVSQDQTCRLWAPLVDSQVWLEMGRPQVHGYDLAAVASISTPTHPHLLVTAADEKELRAFDAPLITCRLLHQACGVQPSDQDKVERVERAYIPSLGLSNKASATEKAEEEEEEEDSTNDKMDEAIAKDLTATGNTKLQLPLERDLGAVSLWPEIQKLFGHQMELYCVTSTLAPRTSQLFADRFKESTPVLVASSCKARDVEGAAIRLWKVDEGKCHQVLQGGHKSTVATLAFSPCATYLASSGKDRRLCLWKQDKSSANTQFSLAWAQDGAHKRIIWSVHFCPWDPQYFVSGSRDGCVKVWQVQETSGTTTATTLQSFAPVFTVNGKPDSVTALSIRPTQSTKGQGVAVLAVGLESGRLEIWNVPLLNPNDVEPTLLCSVPEPLCHRATVTKLAWKPQRGSKFRELLASGSMDHSVRILRFHG